MRLTSVVLTSWISSVTSKISRILGWPWSNHVCVCVWVCECVSVSVCNRLVSQMRAPLAACREPAGKLWQLCKVLYVFSCDQAALQMVFSVCLSVRPSVCLSHLFHHVPIIVSSWNFQELLPWSKVMSMQKFKVRGQRSRSQRSTPNLAVSGL